MTSHFSKVLVTGGAGFIGSHIVDRLVGDGFEVTVVDDLSSGRIENLSKNIGKKDFRFVRGDIRDWGFVKKTVKDVDAIFHEAALVSVARSVKEPLLTNDINVVGTLNVLKAASDSGLRRFVFASSAAVYGDTPCEKIDEGVAVNPLSPYGVSKFVGEFYARYFFNVHGLETVSLRCFNVYGPRQSLDSESSYNGVISIFLHKLLAGSSPTVFGDGEQTRDFVFVEDLVQANMLALNSKNAAGEIFNIGNGVSVSVNDVAETLKSILKKKYLKTVHVSPRRGDIRHSCADISKAKETLGYKPNFSFEEGIRKLVEWYSEEHV
jgi:nucleoside-diphosphate-sugar epimerase